MRAESIGTARTTMKDFTRHNDKLGIDWSKIENGPVASYSHQFSESAYGKDDAGFIATALQFWSDKA